MPVRGSKSLFERVHGMLNRASMPRYHVPVDGPLGFIAAGGPPDIYRPSVA